MSQIVVDTDVASYIFNWHSLAQRYSDALRGSELALCFMSLRNCAWARFQRVGATAAAFSSSDLCKGAARNKTTGAILSTLGNSGCSRFDAVVSPAVVAH